MTYIIAEPCVSTCDTACVEVCPVDCIHGPDDKKGAGAEAKAMRRRRRTKGKYIQKTRKEEKRKIRKVITTFFDGSTTKEVLDSKSNVYYSAKGATKVSVSKPKFFCKL